MVGVLVYRTGFRPMNLERVNLLLEKDRIAVVLHNDLGDYATYVYNGYAKLNMA